jgi:hypothetical protein
MAKMPGAKEFCTREPYFEGEEVFGSQKRKADIPLRSEHESHRPDWVKFSRPRVKTRSTAAPTYTRVMEYHQKKKDKVMEFFFCNDDIERCIKGTKRR